MREYGRKIPWIYKHGVGGSARRVDTAGLEGGRATLAHPQRKSDTEGMTDEEIKAQRAEEEALIRRITRKD